MTEVVPIWVVYVDPDDYPGEVIARKWEIRSGVGEPIATETMIRIETQIEDAAKKHLTPDALKQAQVTVIRQKIKELLPYAKQVPRLIRDDPAILEMWL